MQTRTNADEQARALVEAAMYKRGFAMGLLAEAEKDLAKAKMIWEENRDSETILEPSESDRPAD